MSGRNSIDSASGRSVTAIERAADVMLLFVDAPTPTLGITEIARRLDLSKAVVHRILVSLGERQLVVADEETRRYSLGPAVLRLADTFRERLDVRSIAGATLERLSKLTDETATLSVRDGWQRIYVDQTTPNREVKVTVPFGRPFPLHAGSSSKAFLAFLPEQVQDEFLSGRVLEPLTSLTIVDQGELRRELERIREVGYAVSFGERQAGAGSVAAPVSDHDALIAVISLCGPVERFRDRIDEYAVLLMGETRALSKRLGAVATVTERRSAVRDTSRGGREPTGSRQQPGSRVVDDPLDPGHDRTDPVEVHPGRVAHPLE